ncbi:MAG: ABC transporter ATP-binding protein [Candidatus Hodarchaeales archaeon]|jgi:ABC-type multidrug transport system ATPase subunit
MVVTINKLTKIYPSGIKALIDLSFDIQPGECFGVLGPNGAGKSTILKLLKGLLRPTSGAFSINNVTIDPYTDNQKIKGLTGYLPEDPPEFPTLTAYEYLSMVAILNKVPKKKHEESIGRFLEYFGLKSWVHKPMGSFSEGMKQKVHWIATLLHNPPLILLDDPLRALDVHSFQIITDLLDRLKDLGKTILISTHYLTLVEKTCNRIAIIHKGRLLKIGTLQNLLAETGGTDLNEAYLKLFPQDELPSEDLIKLVI